MASPHFDSPPTDTHAPDTQVLVPGVVRLLVLSGPDQGRELLLERGHTYVVGKDPSVSLPLADARVSRRHLELQPQEHGVLVRDLGSKNGTFVESVRVTEVVARPGLLISLGSTELKLLTVHQASPVLPSQADRFGLLLGRSLVMRQLFAVLERISLTDAAVLIEGETGTGKDVCARSLHLASRRRQRPLITCDLAGVSRSLIESELYGHQRGAFTGADQERAGAFEQADGGTLFIDEVGELELSSQPRLLRALGEGTVKRVGGASYRKVDVRVLSATNRDLAAECAGGRFREDLLHRLAVVRVVVPPLRRRKDDIPLIVERLLEGRGVSCSPEAMALLCEYEWPGNVRELRNALERGVTFLGADRVMTPESLWLSNEENRPREAPPTGNFREMKERLIANWEKAYLATLLQQVNGNVSEAARRSGVPRPYLHELIKKHRLGST